MYEYEKEKSVVFTDDGQRMFLKIRDFVSKTLVTSGVIRMNEVMKAGGGGSSWAMMACVDRLVELGEIREVEQVHDVAGQSRIFTR